MSDGGIRHHSNLDGGDVQVGQDGIELALDNLCRNWHHSLHSERVLTGDGSDDGCPINTYFSHRLEVLLNACTSR